MNEESADARPLTSVELLDAAVWREIGSEEAQPASACFNPVQNQKSGRRRDIALRDQLE
jgi:hypothetical protein